MQNNKVLVVVNTGTERALINLVLEDIVDDTTISVMTGAEALILLEDHRFDLVIIESPTIDDSDSVIAEAVAAGAKVINPKAFVLALVSGPDYLHLPSQDESIAKPFAGEKLRSTIKWALSTI